MPITITIAIYGLTWLLLAHFVRKKESPPKVLSQILIALAVITHGFASYQQIVVPGGYHFSFFKVSSLFLWTTNLFILISSLRLPLQNLFLITLPLAIATLLASLYSGHAEITPVAELNLDMAAHIFLSIMAYSTMIVATVQALLLAYQNHQIRHKHAIGFARLLPPLQTMETHLFEILWAGEVLLTLVIVTGILHIDSIASQHLHHKITFTAIAWVIYGILLWGRHFLGWRGSVATRWALAGFASLILAYWGTKLVFEFLK